MNATWSLKRDLKVSAPNPAFVVHGEPSTRILNWLEVRLVHGRFGLGQISWTDIHRTVAEHKIRFHLLGTSPAHSVLPEEVLEEKAAEFPFPPRFQEIREFVGEPYHVLQPIPVHYEWTSDAFISCFSEANISASGADLAMAYTDLRSLILDVFDSLLEEHPANLGPEPARQLAVLRRYVRKVS